MVRWRDGAWEGNAGAEEVEDRCGEEEPGDLLVVSLSTA